MTQPNRKLPSEQEVFARHAMELDKLATEWLKAYINHPKANQEEAAKLATYLSTVTSKYGVLAMSVGIINRETKRFEHWTHFPDNPEQSLPSYPKLTGHFFSLCEEHLAISNFNKNPGRWIINLFIALFFLAFGLISNIKLSNRCCGIALVKS